MGKNYDDDGLLDGIENDSLSKQPLNTSTPTEKSAEEISLERSLEILKEINRVEGELQQKQSSLTTQLQSIKTIQSQMSAGLQSMEAMAKRQRDVYADMERENKELIGRFSTVYTISENSKKIISDVLGTIVQTMVQEVTEKFKSQISTIADTLVKETDNKLTELGSSYEEKFGKVKKEHDGIIDDLNKKKYAIDDELAERTGQICIPKSRYWTLALLTLLLFAFGEFFLFSPLADVFNKTAASIIIGIISIFIIVMAIAKWAKSDDDYRHMKPVKVSMGQMLYWMAIVILSVVWITLGLVGKLTLGIELGLLYIIVILSGPLVTLINKSLGQ